MQPSIDPIHVLHVDGDPDFAELARSFVERTDERFTVEIATSAAANSRNEMVI